MQGRVHSVESFGSADGPGVRYIVFLQGCPMRCRFCHNPDTWKAEGGELKSVNELLNEAERYSRYWRKDGGITVSGGEALAQIDFLLELFSAAKKRGINTCLDTSLAPFTREGAWFQKFERLIDVCDLMLCDIKHIDAAAHRDLTGRDNANILDAFRYLDEKGQPIWVRHVLVPGITDADDSLRRTREFIASLSNVQRVEVLPYHTLGVFKWEDLGIPYTLGDVEPPTPEQTNRATKILRGELQI
ncbi:pyruvate formate-lyase-activating protein [Paratractidigestivibacter sp.]|uniref:pyruvate formate-lyase-activating protein n=1 Tax=Paratractidigestivibacter sp. TaxID=2847316 RepID=UPI002AC94CEC|nr:pyruvate formate-lyase-activating protein [Paratractidigestivibacter sp.]